MNRLDSKVRVRKMYSNTPLFLRTLRKRNKDRFSWRPKQATTHTEKPQIDVVLQRCAWVAQIFLFGVAIAGYFLTVRPVHQKQLLDEQIAERTVLLRDAHTKLEQLGREESRLTEENTKLAKEFNVTYTRLRSNLLAQLNSVSTSCVYGRDDLLDGQKLVECVSKQVHENVTRHLKPADQEKINAALAAHSDEIISLPLKLSNERTTKQKKIKREVARLRAAIENDTQAFLAEVRRLRANDKNQGTVIKTMDDIKVLQSSEETNAYLDHLRKNSLLVDELQKANTDQIYADFDLKSDLSKALGKIMSNISEGLKM